MEFLYSEFLYHLLFVYMEPNYKGIICTKWDKLVEKKWEFVFFGGYPLMVNI